MLKEVDETVRTRSHHKWAILLIRISFVYSSGTLCVGRAVKVDVVARSQLHAHGEKSQGREVLTAG